MKRVMTGKTYWIAHDAGENIGYGCSPKNGEVWTSRTDWETFTTKVEWKARLKQLGIDIDKDKEEA